jgi:hypothetical protein
MKTDDLIHRLTQDVKPVRPLRHPWRRALLWATASAIYLYGFVALMSPGAVWSAGLSDLRFIVEQMAAIAVGVVAAAAAVATVVPGRSHRTVVVAVAVAAAWVVIVVAGSFQDVLRMGAAGLGVRADWPCVFAIVTGAAAPAVALAMTLRRGAPLTPRMTLALVGLSAAALANVGSCLLRVHDTSLTVLVWHGATVLAAAVVSGVLGTSVLKWRLPSYPESADA